jgi:hypothetical protein
MSAIVRSIGHGLTAAGALLIAVYFCVAYLRGGDAFHDAINPLPLRTYVTLVPLMPGALLLWLADYIATRKRQPSQSPDR